MGDIYQSNLLFPTAPAEPDHVTNLGTDDLKSGNGKHARRKQEQHETPKMLTNMINKINFVISRDKYWTLQEESEGTVAGSSQLSGAGRRKVTRLSKGLSGSQAKAVGDVFTSPDFKQNRVNDGGKAHPTCWEKKQDKGFHSSIIFLKVGKKVAGRLSVRSAEEKKRSIVGLDTGTSIGGSKEKPQLLGNCVKIKTSFCKIPKEKLRLHKKKMKKSFAISCRNLATGLQNMTSGFPDLGYGPTTHPISHTAEDHRQVYRPATLCF